jgi:butyrate kinase
LHRKKIDVEVKAMNEPLILVINPGAMTTKVSLFEGETEIVAEELTHDPDDLSASIFLLDQFPLRRDTVMSFLERHGALDDITAIVARGAPLRPVEGGTYRINDLMLSELSKGEVQSPHVAMYAALIAAHIASPRGIPAFIADPISVDEFSPLARLTGLPEIPRRSLWHALNCRAVVRRYCKETGKELKDLDAIVAHLGSAITVACFEKGRSIDVCNANEESPYSPVHAGTIPALPLVDLCFSGSLTRDELADKLTRKGGLTAHLGTSDALEVERRIRGGDEYARLVYEGMAYGTVKWIGAYAAVLRGKVDAVLLTGSLARSEMLTGWIRERVSFIAPVLIYPGQNEMEALAYAALDVIRGKEPEKTYT